MEKKQICIFVLLAFLQLSTGVHSQPSKCSEEMRSLDLEGCLSAIRQTAVDPRAFAFGTEYIEGCPPEERHTIENINCWAFEPRDEAKTLSELTFRVPDQSLSTIDRYMKVVYTSKPGSYRGCDHFESYQDTKTFEADPLVKIDYKPWDLREHPRVTWDHDEREMFTMIMVDASKYATHMVISNIEGNDHRNELRLFPYTGPLNARSVPRPYALILYKQPAGRRLVPQNIPSTGFNVTEFAERNELEGPVGFTWVSVIYDAYSDEKLSIIQNCANLVEDAIRPYVHNYPFLPRAEDLHLSVFLRIRYSTPAVTYNCGSYNVTHGARDFFVDHQAPAVNSVDVRTVSRRTVYMEMNKFAPTTHDFQNKMYTLMLIRRDGFVNGMKINIDKSGVPSGTEVVTYLGPFPRKEDQEQYQMFLMYEQADELPTTLNFSPYLASQCRVPGRCFNDMGGFLNDHGLKLVGALPLLVRYDEYASCVSPRDG